MDIIYGVTIDQRKVRLSRPLPWSEAIDRWNVLSPSAGSAPHGIAYCAVRDENDPAWPSKGKIEQPRSADGRFCRQSA